MTVYLLRPRIADMAWVTPQYSRTRVDAAANFLAHEYPLMWRAQGMENETVERPWEALGEALGEALEIVNNWRSSHSWPLLSTRLSLMARAKKVHDEALISQRLKRLPAILSKLRRFKKMKFTQMQDIGGCRAVLPSVTMVEKLDRLYQRAAARRQPHQPECIERYDYIVKPKDDGYRGIHLVYKYHTPAAKYAKHDGLRIEIQLRSRLQHEWATAVETVDLFTSQALKSSVGEEAWKRFFLLMGAVFATKERRALPPGVPQKWDMLRDELRGIAVSLRVREVLSAWSYVLKEFSEKKVPGAGTFLLSLDAEAGRLVLRQYTQADQQRANADYLEQEKQILGKPNHHAVLVSVRSIEALRQAYPSFYADTEAFLEELQTAIR